ncbi:copper resistance protein CopC, partial [Streptomyces sp. B1866]|uniref:copper resistance CopC/CopD family protein n=1 Tax=Streptomyces sp. B1866 TaxID=3075431 RepID=UPI0028903A21
MGWLPGNRRHAREGVSGRAPRAARPLPLLGALLAALFGLLALGATPAAAHAALTGTDPADGSVLQTAPRQVSLTFSEGVLLSADSVRVLDPRGRRVEDGRARHLDGRSNTAAVALHAGLPDGTFTVAWQAVSADSHPVGGAFTFSIGAPSKTTVKITGVRPDGTVETVYGAGRYAAYAGFALLVGGCAFAGLARPTRQVARVAVGGWAALFAATLLLLLLRGAYTGGKGVGAAFDLGGLGDVLSTKPGAALLSRLVLLAAAAVFLAVLFGPYARQRDPRQSRDLAFGLAVGGAVVSVGLAATWAMAEHASVGLQSRLAMPVDVAHLLAVALWLGGLAALLASLWAGDAVPGAAVRRFSRLAFGCVVALVGTGVYQSWRQVGSWDALTGTSYGRWLLVKVGLVAVLVGVAAVSRRWTGRLAADGGLSAEEQGGGSVSAVRARTERTAGRTDVAGAPAGPADAADAAGADAAGAGAGAEGSRAADPVRAVQLARQRAAVARAATR